MSTKKKHSKKKLLRIVLEYGLHLWFILFIVNVAIVYTVHFFLIASTCLTPQQISSDNRCLYIWGHQVFQKGTRDAPHQGHPCGSDVTSIIPASHIGNQASYMLPNYVADVCSANAAPTPTPKPTATPVPTNTPVPTPTTAPTVAPTATQAPAQPTAKPTTVAPTSVAATNTPIPTSNTVQVTPTLIPTTAQPANTPPPQATQALAPTTIPTVSTAGPIINLAFSILGIGTNGSNPTPLHPTRNVTVFVYPWNVSVTDATIQPIKTVHTQVTYDSNPASPTYTNFVNSAIDLGTQVKNGQYQIVFKSDGTFSKLIKDKETDNHGKIFNLTQGKILDVPVPAQPTIVGDIFPQPNGDNKMDINDYNSFTNCFGNKADTLSCLNKQAADFDDNGVIDGIDYNIMLRSFKELVALGFPAPVLVVVITPTPTPAPAPTPTSLPTPTRIQLVAKVTITKIVPVSPTAIVETKIPLPTRAITATPTVQKTNANFKQVVLVAGTAGLFLSKAFVILGFLLLLVIVAYAFYKSKTLAKLLHKPTETPHHASAHAEASKQVPGPQADKSQTNEKQPEVATAIDKDYFVKKHSDAEPGVWLTLTDDAGSLLGYYPTKEVNEGFAHIKGTLTPDPNGDYIVISELIPNT